MREKSSVLATERLLEIREQFATVIQRLVPVELDGETLRLILYLEDGTNLRGTEQWHGETLRRYSYYWLTAADDLKIGWDNAPHHTQLENFPHHKHVGHQGRLYPSHETCLEEVMAMILAGKDESAERS